MRRRLRRLLGALATGLALATAGATAADLSPIERRWLQGASPVVAWAQAAGLPLDIVVQPQPTPGLPPLAMAFVGGRCKLVLSMRGNPQAQATLDRLDPGLSDAALALMAAHELGHCHRHLQGAWHRQPAGFSDQLPPARLTPALRADYADMQAVRREEAYADLAGLAWVQQQQPQRYAQLHAWLVAERERDRVAGSHHDTVAWLRLAGDGAVLAATSSTSPSIFDAAARLWAEGLPHAD